MLESKNPQKRILVISNLFHSSPRIPRLLRNLAKRGWSATVITPKVSEGMEKIFNAPPTDLEINGIKIIESGKGRPYEMIKSDSSASKYRNSIKKAIERIDSGADRRLKKTIDRYYWRLYCMFNFPDVEKGWKEDALSSAKEEIRKEKYDLMLSSSSPVITHIICSEIKKEFRIPWIAEYRDLWTLNHNYQLGPIMHHFDKKLELKTMKNADALVTVTDVWAEELQSMFPDKNVQCIPIGFDREESNERIPLTDRFTITYTGQFYHEKQDPGKLLDAISEMMQKNEIDRNKVQVRIYGPIDESLQKSVDQIGLKDVFIQYGVIRRKESLLRQKESQILWYMNWEDPNQKGVPSLKLVEYLSAGRPILLTGGVRDNYMARLIERTNAGEVAISKTEIKEVLQRQYKEYLSSHAVAFYGKSNEIERFDSMNGAIEYSNLMNAIIEKNR